MQSSAWKNRSGPSVERGLAMPSLSTQKRSQCACNNRADRQPTASRIRSKHTCCCCRNLERDRHRNLGDLDRQLQMCRFLQVSVGLTFRQIELSSQALHGLGYRHIALEHSESSIQLPSFI